MPHTELTPELTDALSRAPWRKASRSIGQGGCVEVAPLGDDGLGVAVRDSKNPGGPALVFTAREWDCFLDGAAKGEFDNA